MKSRMNFSEPAQLDPGVDLGCGDRGVSEHLLHGTKVGASRQEVSGKAMSERMGAHVSAQARRLRVALDNLPETNPG